MNGPVTHRFVYCGPNSGITDTTERHYCTYDRHDEEAHQL